MQTYSVDENPYRYVYVDLTGRCNMQCRVCYRPEQDASDLDLAYFAEVCRRLPRPVVIRALGGEPTLHPELTGFISAANAYGHVFTLGTNGRRLADCDFARALVDWRDPEYDGRFGPFPFASFIDVSGGLAHDDVYEQLQGARCADVKSRALRNLLDLGYDRLALTAIIVRGLNEHVIPELLSLAREHTGIRAVHFRNLARVGRFLDTEPYRSEELLALVKGHLPGGGEGLRMHQRTPPEADQNCRDCCFRFVTEDGIHVGVIEFASERSVRCWYRGHLVPDTFELHPWFEHMVETAS